MCPAGQVEAGEPGQTYRMDETDRTPRRQRPVSSWPASLLPSLTLLALLAGTAATTSTAGGASTPPDGPVVEMTVTNTR